MAIKSRAHPLPIPASELARMKEYLAQDYGAEVWTSPDPAPSGTPKRVLVVRVPKADPDLVNDIEAAVEYLSPGDVQNLQQALLVGHDRTLAVGPQVFQDLMAQRVRFDVAEGKSLRTRLAGPGHLLYRSPSDPRKHLRLALRIGKRHVRDLDDKDLEHLASDLGPRLQEPAYQQVRAVYLVAQEDDVRIDADLFLEDLAERWGEESTRRQLAAEIVQREAAAKAQAAAAAAAAPVVQGRDGLDRAARVAYAPLKSGQEGAATWEAPPSAGPGGGAGLPSAPASTASVANPKTGSSPMPAPNLAGVSAEQRARMYEWVDSLPASGMAQASARPATSNTSPLLAPAMDTVTLPAPPAPAPPAPARDPPGLQELAKALGASGFDVMLRPDVPGIPLDLAAERLEGNPQRVIARVMPRFTDDAAQELLQAARSLDVDLALAVADQAEDEARKRIIATKVRHVGPGDVAQMRL